MAKESRFTPEQKMEIVLAGLKNEESIRELCKKHDITTKTYYDWKKAFLSGGRQGLEQKPKSNGTSAVETENKRLKELVAELSVENMVLKKNLR